MQPCVGRKRHRQISDDAVASDEDDSGEDASCKDGPDDTFQRSAFLDMCVLQLVEGPGFEKKSNRRARSRRTGLTLHAFVKHTNVDARTSAWRKSDSKS